MSSLSTYVIGGLPCPIYSYAGLGVVYGVQFYLMRGKRVIDDFDRLVILVELERYCPFSSESLEDICLFQWKYLLGKELCSRNDSVTFYSR